MSSDVDVVSRGTAQPFCTRSASARGGMRMRPDRTTMGRGNRRASNAAVLIIALIATALQDAALATDYTVGNITGWDFAPSPTYFEDWATGLKFAPGDKLVFRYLPIAHNVLEVSEADYKLCNPLSPMGEYETGNDVVTLPKAGTHFYICGFLGHCAQGGMHMRINIVEHVASTPLIPVTPGQLLAPMTSIIPQLPGPGTGNGTTISTVPPPHERHGHAHSPATAPISVPGHSAGGPAAVPRLLVVMFLGVASGAVSLLFW